MLKQLSGGGGMGIAQWMHTASGTWISEKNPGYPFLAAPFQAVGLLQPVSTTEIVQYCGSEHANTLLGRENTTYQGSVSSAKKGIR